MKSACASAWAVLRAVAPSMRVRLLLLAFLAACVSRVEPEVPDYVQRTKSPPFRPPESRKKNPDRVGLTSDEWLRGEMHYMRDDTLEFDSDELDLLTFQWRKVAVLESPRYMTVLLDNQATLSGPIAVKDGKVVVKDRKDEFALFPRDRLVTIVPGGKTERSYWSGKLGLGITSRTGNTNQLDASFSFSLRRRAPRGRFQLDYLGSYSQVNDVETVSNQRLTSRYDIFLSRKWYVTALSIELYRDVITNIDLRSTPQAGFGYYFFKKGMGQSKIDWDVSALLGYRRTSFTTDEPDDTTGNLTFTTSVDWDLTERVEFELAYDVQLGLGEIENSNMNLNFTLAFDLWKDLDLDFTFVWNYVGQPSPNSDGSFPDKNDLKIIFSLAWEF